MWTEEKLNELLAAPSERLIADMDHIRGDILVLGAGGKMGPSLAMLPKRAAQAAGADRNVFAVSRFGDPAAAEFLEHNGIRMIHRDLLEPGALGKLPDAPNVIYMAGRKFGTVGQEHLTWAMNAGLPAHVTERYADSAIVAFSSGNVYPMTDIASLGASEETKPQPIGEYAMSCLARERLFEHGSAARGTPVLLFRLNYAVDLRYGVLYDIASNVLEGRPVPVSTPAFNCIWQGDANEMAIRALRLAASPAAVLNVTGPEVLRVREVAARFGRLLGRAPVFTGEEGGTMLLSNAAKALAAFGPPSVPADTLVEWQAQWLLDGGRSLGKPTHFEQRTGAY
jgi:nucleoside-diphosphate-sugar epimerase